MNGTSGFHEVRSTPSRSPAYRFLHEGAHGTGSAVYGGACLAPSQTQEKK